MWQKHPKNNAPWLKVIAVIAGLQGLWLLVEALLIPLLSETSHSPSIEAPPFQVWSVWIIGLFSVLAVNEAVKRQEIKIEVRYQKRQRLEFGTKLGINSPF